MRIAKTGKLAGALALSLGVVLSGCGGMPTNKSLYSVKQPVVQRTNYTLDVATDQSGLSVGEQSRLNGWFEAMDLRYGDRVTVENPTGNPAVVGAVNEIANRHGIIVDQVAPTTSGFINPGQARVVLTRSTASVPGCPDWSARSDMNYGNAASPGYGCAVNGNLAAMVADPQDLIEGKKGSGETVIATGTKAIDIYRDAQPSGAGGLQSAQGGGD